MLKKALISFLVFMLAINPTITIGQGGNKKVVERTTEKKVSGVGTKHPLTREIEDAILHLEKVNSLDRPFMRYFTTYAVPDRLQKPVVDTLNFVIHSLIGVSDDGLGNTGSVHRVKQVTKTLYAIDIRNYNWTEQAWEDMSKIDGYVVEPIVEHRRNTYLKLIAGNALVRADWFIVHATDMTRQTDLGRKSIYETLLYASNKTKPKTTEEWRKYWGLDRKTAERFGGVSATLVTLSKAVARHNRFLFHYRSQTGWLYETYDVLHQEGERDYVENFLDYKGRPPTSSDAGEIFGSNLIGLQVYALRNDKDELVSFGDPTAVRHISDKDGDVRVRNATSCMDCHAVGPLTAENTADELIKVAVQYVKNKDDQLRIRKVFLSGKFAESVADNQIFFARAMKKVNGLTPAENSTNFLNIIEWYNKPVTLEQAAIECGLPVDKFVEKAKAGIVRKGQIPPRLILMVKGKQAIPRDVWETPGREGIPGMFQRTMVYLYGLTTVVTKVTEITETETVIEVAKSKYGRIKVLQDTSIKSGNDVLGKAKKGEILLISKEWDEQNEWVHIGKGWIKKSHVERLKK